MLYLILVSLCNFDRETSITFGDLSYLSVGMGVRGYVSRLKCIPMQNGSITDYEVGKSCMGRHGHGINSNRLQWINYKHGD